MKGYIKSKNTIPISEVLEAFGIRSMDQFAGDMSFVISKLGKMFRTNLSSIDFIRPDISIPAYLGLVPEDGISPIYHLYDRDCGGDSFCSRATRETARDFRGNNLSYDDHDGIDFVCPPGTNLCAAAPGRVVMIRDYWLRGGLTLAVDHGGGLITQYTHCWKPLTSIGQEVHRGEPVALSGVAGIDMTMHFPWVPPHVHFMTWLNGRPIDPYLKEGEDDRPGTWIHRNNPRPSEINYDEAIPNYSEVDENAIDEIIQACTGEKVIEHLEAASGKYYTLAAILEDALHHEDWAWPEGYRYKTVRPEMKPTTTKLSLPLPADTYKGAYFADSEMPLSQIPLIKNLIEQVL